jgi:hypothetical protein
METWCDIRFTGNGMHMAQVGGPLFIHRSLKMTKQEELNDTNLLSSELCGFRSSTTCEYAA